MSLQKEAVEQAINYYPDNQSGLIRVDLGQVDGDRRLVHGIFAYPQRVVSLPGQPYTGETTRQPVWALVAERNGEKSGAVTPLAYTADVLGLREDIAVVVLDRINVLRERVS